MRRRGGQRPSWLMYSAGAGFLAGVAVTAAIRPAAPTVTPPTSATSAATGEVQPTLKETPPAVAAPPPPSAAAPPVISADPIEDLRRRQLTLPVERISKEDIRDNFDEMRGGNRRHEAIDLLAPRNTPVLAVEDGTIARLFLSDAGGITIYHFDPTETYVYYYAHLEGYAMGLKETRPHLARPDDWLRRHYWKRAARHAPPPLRDLQDGRRKAVVAWDRDRSVSGASLVVGCWQGFGPARRERSERRRAHESFHATFTNY